MRNLALTFLTMRSNELPVGDVTMDDDGKVHVHWEQPPTEHQRKLAQFYTMDQPCIHCWS